MMLNSKNPKKGKERLKTKPVKSQKVERKKGKTITISMKDSIKLIMKKVCDLISILFLVVLLWSSKI